MSLLCRLGLHSYDQDKINGFKDRKPDLNEVIRCTKCDEPKVMHWNWNFNRFAMRNPRSNREIEFLESRKLSKLGIRR